MFGRKIIVVALLLYAAVMGCVMSVQESSSTGPTTGSDDLASGAETESPTSFTSPISIHSAA